MRFAFEHAGLHRVQPAVMPRNAASQRVVEKAGFRHEGLAVRYLRIAGAWEDHDLYAITVEEHPGPGLAMTPWPFPRPACAGCAGRRSCATSSARRGSTPSQFVLPLFVEAGAERPQPDRAMPGVDRLGIEARRRGGRQRAGRSASPP